jgi:hypothetical protein
MNCQHCNEPNPEGYFNCPSCGERASKPKFTPQFVVRENNSWARAIRTDQIDFGRKNMGEHIEELKKKNLTPKLGTGDFAKVKGS